MHLQVVIGAAAPLRKAERLLLLLLKLQILLIVSFDRLMDLCGARILEII